MFNLKLKEIRTEKGLTQKQTAILLNCNQSMIARWEKGECEPTESIIRRTAIVFDVTTDYLLGLEDIDGHKESTDYEFRYEDKFQKFTHKEKK